MKKYYSILFALMIGIATTASVRAANNQSPCEKSTRAGWMDEYLWVDSSGVENCRNVRRPVSEGNAKCYECRPNGGKPGPAGCNVMKLGDKLWLPFGAANGDSTLQGAESFVAECVTGGPDPKDSATSDKWKAKKVVVTCPDERYGENKRVENIVRYNKKDGKESEEWLFYNANQDVYCQKLPEKYKLHHVTISGDNSQVIISEQNASRLKIKRAWTRLNAMSDDFKVSVWRDKQGNFNTARLASDSIAAVVLGTTGALVTSNIVKKNQVSGGFEDVQCTIGGQVVATWGDDFSVGIQ